MNTLKKSLLVTIVFALLGLTNIYASDIGKTSSETAAPSKGEIKEKAADHGSAAVSGWEKTSYEKYSFFLPKSWKNGGVDGAWCPGDQGTTTGLPTVSLYVGSIPPMMSGNTIEEKLKFYYNSVPDIIGKVKKCGMEGMLVETTFRGVKNRGLILIYGDAMTIDAMTMLDFFNCRAPEGDFYKYEETFKKILDSVGC